MTLVTIQTIAAQKLHDIAVGIRQFAGDAALKSAYPIYSSDRKIGPQISDRVGCLRESGIYIVLLHFIDNAIKGLRPLFYNPIEAGRLRGCQFWQFQVSFTSSAICVAKSACSCSVVIQPVAMISLQSEASLAEVENGVEKKTSRLNEPQSLSAILGQFNKLLYDMPVGAVCVINVQSLYYCAPELSGSSSHRRL